MNKRMLGLVCLNLFLAAVLFGCGAGSDKQKIFDDEAGITQDGDTYTFVNRTGSTNSDEDVALAYTGFSGVQTIWIIEVSAASEVDFEFNSTVDDGDFKVVLVTPDKEIVTLLTGTQQGTATQELTQGKYAVKLLGRNADGQINLSLTPGPNVNLATTE